MNKWIGKYLSEADIKKISSVVAQAEKHTSGEIVPMIVLSSSSTGHVFFSLTMFLLVLGVSALVPISNLVADGEILYVLPGMVIIFTILSFWLSRFHVMQRFFIPRADRAAQVWRRAWSEFALAKISKTEQRTGVLVFVSIMERKAVILADEQALENCPQDCWKEIVSEMGGSLKRGDWVQGFEKAIARCAETLAKHLPASQQNVNELPNSLIIKE